MRHQVILFLTIILFSIPSFAQQSPAYSQQIVVTASSTEETLEETPASVTVIDNEEIERRAARDVEEVLREVPGLTLIRSGSRGKATSLFTRGGESNHTLVLWNGVELDDPYFGGFDWGRFSTIAVERIEIVRGPFSALYGSDAVTGVVNVITRSRGNTAEGRLEAGERSLINAGVVAGFSRGPLNGFAATEIRQDDGFAPNDYFEQSVLNGRLAHEASVGSVALSGRWTEYENGVSQIPSADLTRWIVPDERRVEGGELQLTAPLDLFVSKTSIQAVVSWQTRDEEFNDPQDPFGFTYARTDSETFRGRLDVTRQTPIGTVTAGAEYEEAVVDDVSTFGPNLSGDERRTKALYVEDRFSHAFDSVELELSVGARYDDYDTFGSQISPRVAGALILGTTKLRAAVGESFRAPSVVELYYPLFGNPELEPEIAKNVELGLDQPLGGGLASLTLFRNDFDEMISYDVGANRFANSGAALSQGVEVGWTRRSKLPWRIGFSYTWLDTEDDSTGEPLLRRPEHSGSVSVGYAHGAFDATLVMLHTGERRDVVEILPFGTVTNDAYTTVDLALRYAFGDWTPLLRVENLLDEEYEEIYGYPSPSRRVVAGVRYRIDR